MLKLSGSHRRVVLVACTASITASTLAVAAAFSDDPERLTTKPASATVDPPPYKPTNSSPSEASAADVVATLRASREPGDAEQVWTFSGRVQSPESVLRGYRVEFGDGTAEDRFSALPCEDDPKGLDRTITVKHDYQELVTATVSVTFFTASSCSTHKIVSTVASAEIGIPF